MSTISTQLRNFKDPTKDEIVDLFFCIPSTTLNSLDGSPAPAAPAKDPAGADDVERMEINATLTAGPETEEESYVRSLLSET
jgi:hypothetical protein